MERRLPFLDSRSEYFFRCCIRSIVLPYRSANGREAIPTLLSNHDLDARCNMERVDRATKVSTNRRERTVIHENIRTLTEFFYEYIIRVLYETFLYTYMSSFLIYMTMMDRAKFPWMHASVNAEYLCSAL